MICIAWLHANAWWIGVFGIVLEVAGASYLISTSWKSRREFLKFPVPVTYDTYIASLEAVILTQRRQFYEQARGFAALAGGLALQVVGQIRWG